MEKPYVIGADIGGQTTKIGIVDRTGNIISQTVISSRYDKDGAYLFMDAFCNTIKEFTKEVGIDNIQGIGIGAPNGNYYKGTIGDAANLEWTKGKIIPLASTITQGLGGIPVTVTNDANSAAIGEMTYGAAKGMKDFIMITLGTGIGSGIIINGDLVYGHDGFAGELGHTCSVRENGRQCSCGKKGCLETYASAVGVVRTVKEWLETTQEPSLLREIKEVTSKDVFEAAKKGDKMAIKIFEFTGKKLGESFADFVAFSAPEAIILFGGLARAYEFIIKPIEDTMNDNLISTWKGKIKIIPSALKESDAAILGASALGW